MLFFLNLVFSSASTPVRFPADVNIKRRAGKRDVRDLVKQNFLKTTSVVPPREIQAVVTPRIRISGNS